jgi:hypothetical protein
VSCAFIIISVGTSRRRPKSRREHNIKVDEGGKWVLWVGSGWNWPLIVSIGGLLYSGVEFSGSATKDTVCF